MNSWKTQKQEIGEHSESKVAYELKFQRTCKHDRGIVDCLALITTQASLKKETSYARRL